MDTVETVQTRQSSDARSVVLEASSQIERTTMDIDRDAPVIATASVVIDAGPERVWDVLAHVDRWPKWNPDVHDAHLQGPLAAGSAIRWHAGPGTITSILATVEAPRQLGWTGRTLGIKAVHVWRLEPEDGRTRLTTEESWRGLPVRLSPRRMRAMLEKAVTDGLVHVRREAERRDSLRPAA